MPNDLAAWTLRAPDEDMKRFAGWIYANPSRCPALRLADEFYHAVRRNASYIPSDSLIGDFAHLKCLPYVDLITLDRATMDHVRRVSDRIMAGCAAGVCKDAGELIRRLT